MHSSLRFDVRRMVASMSRARPPIEVRIKCSTLFARFDRRLLNIGRCEVPKGQEKHWDGKKKFLLGHTMREAAKVWGDRMQQVDPEAGKPNLKLGELIISPFGRSMICWTGISR